MAARKRVGALCITAYSFSPSCSSSMALRLLLLAHVASVSQAFSIDNRRGNTYHSVSRIQNQQHSPVCHSLAAPPLMMSDKIFYNDFEDFDKDDDGDDDDDDEERDEEVEKFVKAIDEDAIANFRTRMSSTFDAGAPSAESIESTAASTSDTSAVDELISFATRQNQPSSTDWAKVAPQLQEGVVLLANPASFCSDFGGATTRPLPALLSKFGLTLPPPAELGADRRADLLPVLLVVQVTPSHCCAVLLNRRTGYLLGDLEQPSAIAAAASDDNDDSTSSPLLEKFCVQPLWFGGIENDGMGLDMLHPCGNVAGAKPLTSDGLYWGGDPAQAQELMASETAESTGNDKVLTGFDFKFFVQSTVWKTADLQREIDNGTWFAASVSKQVLFKSRDRMGTQRAKPLWSECMELLGGKCKTIRDELYADEM